MNKKSVSRLFPALFALGSALLVLVACTPSFGVFSEIQTEKAQIGSDIFKNATVKALGEDGTNYYAVMGKVFYRPITGGSWKVLAVNGDSDYFCGGFASDGSSIYVATLDTASTALKGIYQGTVGGSVWSTAIGTTAFGTETVDALFLAGTELFALTHAGSSASYKLYSSSLTTTPPAAFVATALPNQTEPVLGVVWDRITKYWALTSSKVYNGNAASSLSTPDTPGSGKTFGGIAVDASNSVLVTTTDGYLYTNSADSWSGAVEVDSGVGLGALIEVPVNADAAVPYRLIIAKNDSSYGYFEYDATASTTLIGNDAGAIFAPAASSYTTTVHQKPVQAILYSSGVKKTIMIGLAAQGTYTYALYSNTYSGGVWSGWTAE